MEVTHLHPAYVCAFLLRFINNSRLNPQAGNFRTKSAIPSVRWMESLSRKLISYAKQVSWLTDQTSALLLACFSGLCNGIVESRLSEYSDRIVQDSHLIPFLAHTARTWHSIFCTFLL